MNLVDSSGWLEYFADGPNAEFFAPAVEATGGLVVSAINIYEVFKRLLVQGGEDDALQAVATMQQAAVIDLDATLGLAAARLTATLKLPMVDSMILATAQLQGATLWTQDAHFEGLEGVQYIEQRTR